MTKEDFLEQYVLSRVSHKRSIEDLLKDGIKAWNFIHVVK
jgi:hypothetical protein